MGSRRRLHVKVFKLKIVMDLYMVRKLSDNINQNSKSLMNM